MVGHKICFYEQIEPIDPKTVPVTPSYMEHSN